MSGFYELKCVDSFGFTAYYYFYSLCVIRNVEDALNYGFAPEKMRILIEDRNDSPYGIRSIHSPIEYFYLKYVKKAGTFKFDGYRVNWEKENI